ncbi:MAG TPA: GNAT family N-acetyltransferase [Solirubrobacteraceae bacterium]|jgi:GNAT superfamily N-acetyltransferase|nr:GNAT family N-acetyltransferase [Solirubrobacteraceae bacterium]
MSLYQRGVETLLASWEAYAEGSTGAALHRLDGVSAAVFPAEPERGIYNNALLFESDAVAAMEALYARAGVERFAAWVHERDSALAHELERRGYVLDTTTRAMGMSLADVAAPRPELDLADDDWADYLRLFDLSPELLNEDVAARFHLRIARLDGESVAASLAFDCDGDCGVYNVGTLDHARRRGLGSAVTLLALHEARDRGCTTASLQATPMAERLYAALGFRDLGRYLEYMPGTTSWASGPPV